MRIGIAIDVSTDVSREFELAHGIQVLPSTLHLDGRPQVYDRDPQTGLAFYREKLLERFPEAQSTPFSAAEIEQLFLQRLVLDYDYVFLITLTGTRSKTFENAHRASLTILRDCQNIRARHGIEGPFALQVVDSQSLFTGPALLAWEAVNMARARRSPVDIRKRLAELVPQAHAYLVPDDLWHVRIRGRMRGDRSVSLPVYLLGRLLDIKPVIHAHRGETRPVAKLRQFRNCVEQLFARATERIRAGLEIPVVAISFGGDPSDVPGLPGFPALAETARAHGVELMVAMMSPAGAVNVGNGAVTLAYCAPSALEFG
jgi:DegV family protein with EDD domain